MVTVESALKHLPPVLPGRETCYKGNAMGFEADEIQNYNIEQYLTVEQIAEFREAFDLFLPDDKVVNIGLCKADFWWPDIPVDELEREVVAAKPGHLPLALLPATLRALGQSPERYDLDVLRRILDPALSFQEFCGVLHHYNRRRHMNDYDLMWEALGWRDPNGTGDMPWKVFVDAIHCEWSKGEALNEEDIDEMRGEFEAGRGEEVRCVLRDHHLVAAGSCVEDVQPAHQSFLRTLVIGGRDPLYHPEHEEFLRRCHVFDAFLMGALEKVVAKPGSFTIVVRDAHLMEMLWRFMALPDVTVELIRWRVAAMCIMLD